MLNPTITKETLEVLKALQGNEKALKLQVSQLNKKLKQLDRLMDKMTNRF